MPFLLAINENMLRKNYSCPLNNGFELPRFTCMWVFFSIGAYYSTTQSIVG